MLPLLIKRRDFLSVRLGRAPDTSEPGCRSAAPACATRDKGAVSDLPPPPPEGGRAANQEALTREIHMQPSELLTRWLYENSPEEGLCAPPNFLVLAVMDVYERKQMYVPSITFGFVPRDSGWCPAETRGQGVRSMSAAAGIQSKGWCGPGFPP